MAVAPFTPAAKPTLEGVLDHLGVRYVHKTGGQKVLCPIHDDRKPSCSLDLGKQLINCQSCDFGSDSWGLLQAAEGITFKDAVALADRLGLPRVDQENPGADRRRVAKRVQRSALVSGTVGAGDSPAPYVPSWRRR